MRASTAASSFSNPGFRESLSRCEVVLENLPFKAQDSDDWRERGRSIMRAFHGRLEDWVRVYPDDWYWLQERWKP